MRTAKENMPSRQRHCCTLELYFQYLFFYFKLNSVVAFTPVGVLPGWKPSYFLMIMLILVSRYDKKDWSHYRDIDIEYTCICTWIHY